MKARAMNIYMSGLIAVILMCVSGCETDGEETMSWRPGNSLHIVGSSEIIMGEDESYYVDGFTINETYTWTLDGNEITPERQGEFVTLNFPSVGTHELEVSNGTMTGSLTIDVVEE